MMPIAIAKNPKNFGAIAHMEPITLTVTSAMIAAPIGGRIFYIHDSKANVDSNTLEHFT
jgi:hypothetical protein